MHRRAFIAALVATVTGMRCRSRAILINARSSPEDLANAVLDALNHRDRAGLERLALSEDEFRTYVWPDLPAARPERNLPFSFVWGDLNQKSRNALAGTVASHGGQNYRLVAVRFRGETTRYSTATVHRQTELTVRGTDGSESELRLFGSSIECDGSWKVFSYVTD